MEDGGIQGLCQGPRDVEGQVSVYGLGVGSLIAWQVGEGPTLVCALVQ
jgi:hypothetical protein